jgi:hypothetical protein
VFRWEKIFYYVIHPIVTYFFGSLILAVFIFLGWLAPIGILKKPLPPILYFGGSAGGWIVGLLIVTRIYLVDGENREYRKWLYLLAIIVGALCYLEERGFTARFVPNMIALLLPVPLLYLGYLGTKLRIRYLQKKKIKQWREKGLT